MSAWDRLPANYRKLCEEIAKNSKPKLSPQNRRVRDAADRYLASKRVTA